MKWLCHIHVQKCPNSRVYTFIYIAVTSKIDTLFSSFTFTWLTRYQGESIILNTNSTDDWNICDAVISWHYREKNSHQIFQKIFFRIKMPCHFFTNNVVFESKIFLLHCFVHQMEQWPTVAMMTNTYQTRNSQMNPFPLSQSLCCLHKWYVPIPITASCWKIFGKKLVMFPRWGQAMQNLAYIQENYHNFQMLLKMQDIQLMKPTKEINLFQI